MFIETCYFRASSHICSSGSPFEECMDSIFFYFTPTTILTPQP